MLQYRAVDPATVELLKNLMKVNELQDFVLVGGTALALQIGHRVSVDIDLFTQQDFDPGKVFEILNYHFNCTDSSVDVNTLNINISMSETLQHSVKVDFLKYGYPYLNPVRFMDGIRLLSVEDIIPMKLSAIAGRGSKKDFYDIYYLLQSFSLQQMIELFEQKFVNANTFHILKSLTYFDDAEMEPDPKTIETSDWNLIKETIFQKTNEFLK
jgi:predicted nucleotidyltransferase component of viral defense system